MEPEGSYDAASSQLSRDEDGDGGPPSLTVHTTNNRSWSWVRPLNVLELDLLALVLVLEAEQVELDELELKRKGEVDEACSLTSINSELTPSLASNDSNSDLTTLRIVLTTRQEALD